MKPPQILTLAYGLLYLAIGVAGFIPSLTPATSNPGQGMLVGLFAVNPIHSLLHLGFGAILVWGGIAAQHVIPATRLMTAAFVAILVAGFVPPLADVLQLDSSDIAPHVGSALVAGILWWAAQRRVPTSRRISA